MEFDGDYLNVYIDSTDNLLGCYCYTNSETIMTLRNFVRNNVWNRPYDLSGIIWPRHADGTSDFDLEVKAPFVKLVPAG